MDESDALEFWNERAPILQYDGGRSQPDAELTGYLPDADVGPG